MWVNIQAYQRGILHILNNSIVFKMVFLQNVSLQNVQIQNVPAPKRIKPQNVPNTERPKSQTVRASIRPSPKTSQPHNVPTPQHPSYKTSKASKCPRPQNVPNTKRPKPQNVPIPKTSQLQNVPTLLYVETIIVNEKISTMFTYCSCIIIAHSKSRIIKFCRQHAVAKVKKKIQMVGWKNLFHWNKTTVTMGTVFVNKMCKFPPSKLGRFVAGTFWGWDVLGAWTFSGLGRLRPGMFWGFGRFKRGTFWGFEVLGLGTFLAGTSWRWTFCWSPFKICFDEPIEKL